MSVTQQRFCIVGLGLLGGSYALALTKAGKEVFAIDKDKKAIDFALESGMITSGGTHNCEKYIESAQVIVLALYPSDCVLWVRENSHLFCRGTVVTDVCGVKSGITQEIQSLLPNGVEFIAAHPMAGKEVSGVSNADNNMFLHANYIVVPTEKNTQESIDFAISLGKLLKFNNISILSCAEHDKMIAYLSQLTHAIAVSLMVCSDNNDIHKYTGDSFRDLTRIAKINAPMWAELFLCNKVALLDEIDKFTVALGNLRDKLSDGDKDGLLDLFVNSTEKRKIFDEEGN